jgi:hypothetical protein
MWENLRRLPQALKAHHNFVLWREEIVNGRGTKVPYQAGPGLKKASSADPSTWSSFNEAMAVLTGEHGTEFNGLGICFEGSGITGIDLDNTLCEGGDHVSWATDLMAELHSYSETSPNGRGIHVYMLGSFQGAGIRSEKFSDDTRFEMYCRGRYFTLTGNQLPGTPAELNEFDCEQLANRARRGEIGPPGDQIKRVIANPGFPVPNGEAYDVEAFFRRHGIEVLSVKQDNGSTIYIIACPTEHGGYDPRDGRAFVVRLASGALSAGCLHESCPFYHGSGNHWRELRERYEPPGYNSPPEPPPERPEKEPPEECVGLDWHDVLIHGKKGKPANVLANVITALSYADEWHGLLSFNEFTSEVVTQRPTPWKTPAGSKWTDTDDSRCAAWLQREEHILAGSKVVAEAVQVVARDHSFHPVRTYLKGLQWDNQPRIDTWLTTYLGVENNKYSRAVGRCWLISAVTRIFRPGCQCDYMLLLEGPQGLQKSTALRELTGDEWFADRLSDLSSKDAHIELLGKWIIEMGELPNLRGVTLERFKAFITARFDRFRPPYGRRTVEHPRQCVLAASSNNKEPFIDPTGNRRIWPVECGVINIPRIKADRDQLWAEAHQSFTKNESWWLNTPELNRLAEEEQDAHYEPGVWDEIILPWIENPAQRQTLEGKPPNQVMVPVEPWLGSEPGKVSITDILIHAVGKDKDRLTQADRNQVSRCVQHIKWTYKQDRSGAYCGKRYYHKPE